MDETNKKSYVAYMGFFLAVLLVGIGVFYLAGVFEKEEGDKKELRNDGTIYLTLEALDGSVPQGLYSFDVATRRLEELFVEQGMAFITNSFLPTGKVMTFVSWDFGGTQQIFTVDIRTREISRITRSTSQAKTNPKWSPDGTKIAFAASVARTRKVETPSNAPEKRNVYITDLEGNETFITAGTYPKWSPDGTSLLLMKNDGLHLYTIESREGRLVWSVVNGQASRAMKFELSPDKSMIAWTNVFDGEVVLGDIVSWTPLEIVVTDRIAANAFWPVFSPDGRRLALQEIDFNAETPNPRLVIYDLDTLEREVVLDLTDYNQQKMFVTDWQQ